MMMPRFVYFLLLLHFLLPGCSGPVQPSPEELLKRVKSAQLQWGTYQEDIKGQIGATPVALWDGLPDSIEVKDNRIDVKFIMKPPWNAYSVAMPVLLRGPLGKVYTNTDFKISDGYHHCIFEIPELAEFGTLPWVEVHYPHHERRFSLQNGQWKKE